MTEDPKQVIADAVEKTIEVAEETAQRPWVKRLARLGFYTKGFLFVVIGSLAIAMIAGLRGGRIADATGALSAVSEEPYGKFFLIVFIIGAVGHGIWNILRAAADIDDLGHNWLGIIKRCIAAGIGFFYLGLAWSTFELISIPQAVHAGDRVEQTFMAIVLGVPLLGAMFASMIGIGFIAGGFSECYSGLSGKFRENYRVWEIKGVHRAFINILGVLSFTARALLLGVMGYFFIRAALYNDPGTPIGIDAALLALLRSGYGRTVVAVTAAGLVGHGILAFYEAKYWRIC